MEHDGPTLLALTRQNRSATGSQPGEGAGCAKGAYILSEADGGAPDVILIGTGSEVALCVKAQERLKRYGVKARVVSMPSWNLFDAQDEAYRESVLPESDQEASDRGGRLLARLASLGRRGDDHRHRPLRRIRSRRRDLQALRLHGGARRLSGAALLGRMDDAKQEYGGETAFATTAPSDGHS